MKKVSSAPSLITVSHWKNLLQSEGIDAFLRNEHTGSVVGEIPFVETWPEVWVRNDLDYRRALELIDTDRLAAESPQESWRCGNCGEEVEGQFAACWSCGQPQ